jgi:hypothetical protein
VVGLNSLCLVADNVSFIVMYNSLRSSLIGSVSNIFSSYIISIFICQVVLKIEPFIVASNHILILQVYKSILIFSSIIFLGLLVGGVNGSMLHLKSENWEVVKTQDIGVTAMLRGSKGNDVLENGAFNTKDSYRESRDSLTVLSSMLLAGSSQRAKRFMSTFIPALFNSFVNFNFHMPSLS